MTNMTHDLELSTAMTQLCLRPSWGGRVVSLTHEGRDVLHPLQATAGFNPSLWPKGGAYPLFPFHNRIPHGRFVRHGQEVQLPLHPYEPCAVHGHAHQHPWQVTAATATTAELLFQDDGQGAWPWAFEARQDFTIHPGRLTVGLSITNLSGCMMPAGLGWHPFFIKADTLVTDAAREWAIGPDLLPTGDWTVPQPGAATRYLSDWSDVRMRTASGLDLHLQATAPLAHLVIHDPDGPYSCVEPVSHLANAMNLRPGGGADDLADLAPGERLDARVELAFNKAPCR